MILVKMWYSCSHLFVKLFPCHLLLLELLFSVNWMRNKPHFPILNFITVFECSMRAATFLWENRLGELHHALCATNQPRCSAYRYVLCMYNTVYRLRCTILNGWWKTIADERNYNAYLARMERDLVSLLPLVMMMLYNVWDSSSRSNCPRWIDRIDWFWIVWLCTQKLHIPGLRVCVCECEWATECLPTARKAVANGTERDTNRIKCLWIELKWDLFCLWWSMADVCLMRWNRLCHSLSLTHASHDDNTQACTWICGNWHGRSRNEFYEPHEPQKFEWIR